MSTTPTGHVRALSEHRTGEQASATLQDMTTVAAILQDVTYGSTELWPEDVVRATRRSACPTGHSGGRPLCRRTVSKSPAGHSIRTSPPTRRAGPRGRRVSGLPSPIYEDPEPAETVVVGPGGGECELGGDVRWGGPHARRGGGVVVEVEGTVDSGRGVVVEVVTGAGVAAGALSGEVVAFGLSGDVQPVGGAAAPD